ncbi:jg9597 [Pararge aegeria aegeria]|uniref:Jg9597 protein n=1 Tax=Pararge aegeria aegeria TaxID=348720 RepID=A0A8S4S9V1_9NEOP|nr:jg9597 [Pararge aegeria aegeria]
MWVESDPHWASVVVYGPNHFPLWEETRVVGRRAWLPLSQAQEAYHLRLRLIDSDICLVKPMFESHGDTLDRNNRKIFLRAGDRAREPGSEHSFSIFGWTLADNHLRGCFGVTGGVGRARKLAMRRAPGTTSGGEWETSTRGCLLRGLGPRLGSTLI